MFLARWGGTEVGDSTGFKHGAGTVPAVLCEVHSGRVAVLEVRSGVGVLRGGRAVLLVCRTVSPEVGHDQIDESIRGMTEADRLNRWTTHTVVAALGCGVQIRGGS